MANMENSPPVLDTFEKACGYLRYNERLPDEFTDYHLIDERSEVIGGVRATLAHTAASYGVLPEWFKDYHLKDIYGRTVAHVAARYGHLPVWFNEWHLVDQDGISVIEEFIDHGMKNWPDRTTLFNLKVWVDREISVADYIIEEDEAILNKYRATLKAEVLAWKVAKEIKNIQDGAQGNKPAFRK